MSLNKLQHYFMPEDGGKVVELLGKYQDSALIVAGGTFLHGLIARDLVTETQALIDIHKLGLDHVKFEPDKVRIGSTTTFTQLQASPGITDVARMGAVKDALEYPPPQVKNSATVGGCVAASCPFFDLPVSFLALDGIVQAQGSGGYREVRLQDFFPSLFENVLEANEFISEIILPLPTSESASAFIKLETNANDLAILNAAVCVTLDESGQCEEARIFVGGGVGEVPVRADSAEKILNGNKLNDEICAEAGQAAKSDVDPMTDHRASSKYRKHMTGILVERAVRKVITRLNQ
jgi:CO/xanthine dehydrogenase FAD-binding subunit